MLDSQIATTSQLSLLRQFVSRPIEEVWTYRRLDSSSATDLYKIMKDRFGDIGSLEGAFRFAWDSCSELGKWCSNRAWAYALGDDVLPKLEGKVTKLQSSDTPTRIPEAAYNEIARIREASDIVKNHPCNHPNAPGELSPKVQLLYDKLTQHFGQPGDTKCIVFIERRSTAKVLFELFSTLSIPHLRPGVLIGIRSGDMAEMNTTFRQQFATLLKLRNGEINCLVSVQLFKSPETHV
jgi:endoribonuclease Dicer